MHLVDFFPISFGRLLTNLIYIYVHVQVVITDPQHTECSDLTEWRDSVDALRTQSSL